MKGCVLKRCDERVCDSVPTHLQSLGYHGQQHASEVDLLAGLGACETHKHLTLLVGRVGVLQGRVGF